MKKYGLEPFSQTLLEVEKRRVSSPQHDRAATVLAEVFRRPLREAPLGPTFEPIVKKFAVRIADLGGDAERVSEALREFAREVERAEGEDTKELDT